MNAPGIPVCCAVPPPTPGIPRRVPPGITACCLNDFAGDDTPPEPPVPPPVPRLDVTAVPDSGGQSVTVTWRVLDGTEEINNDTITEYRAIRDAGLPVVILGRELTDYPPQGEHTYIIQAYTADGTWVLTGAVTVRLEAPALPYYPWLNAPSEISATADNENQIINVNWSEVFGAASYNIYRATDPDGPYTLIANTTALTISDANVQRGVTYYYKAQTVSEPPSTDDPPLSLWAQAEFNRIVTGLLAEQAQTEEDGETGEIYDEPLRLTDEYGDNLATENSDI